MLTFIILHILYHFEKAAEVISHFALNTEQFSNASWLYAAFHLFLSTASMTTTSNKRLRCLILIMTSVYLYKGTLDIKALGT